MITCDIVVSPVYLQGVIIFSYNPLVLMLGVTEADSGWHEIPLFQIHGSAKIC